MVSWDGPPVSNPITGTWRNSFADKDQKGRDLQKFDRVEELICDRWGKPTGTYYLFILIVTTTKKIVGAV
jgi:hypothetical protein